MKLLKKLLAYSTLRETLKIQMYFAETFNELREKL